MSAIRQKSVMITGYLEHLLHASPHYNRSFKIITPSSPEWRGTQLSVMFSEGKLDTVSATLDEAGIVADKRKPDVMRVAPVPLYNTYAEVFEFVKLLNEALDKLD